jgi:hypothetical protein
MTMEERNKWMNKKALQKDAEVIAEITEQTAEEDFQRCRE